MVVVESGLALIGQFLQREKDFCVSDLRLDDLHLCVIPRQRRIQTALTAAIKLHQMPQQLHAHLRLKMAGHCFEAAFLNLDEAIAHDTNHMMMMTI